MDSYRFAANYTIPESLIPPLINFRLATSATDDTLAQLTEALYPQSEAGTYRNTLYN